MLICPDCDYQQKNVPDFVWTAEHIETAMERDFNELYQAVKRDE